MFLSLSCAVEGGSGVSRTRTREVPLREGVCISGVAAGVYVCCFTCSRAQKGVWQMVRVKSTDFCQPWLWSKLLPKVQVYVRSCSSISSHVIMFLFLSCRVSRRWE